MVLASRFLDQELLHEGAAAQPVDRLQFFEDLPALAVGFRGSGSGGCARQSCISKDTIFSKDFALD